MTLGKNFRLPLDARPLAYRADLRLDLGADRFDGALEIDVHLTAPRAVIHLHAVALEIRAASAAVDGRTLPAATTADAESETVTLAFAEALPAGELTLQLAYAGAFSPGLRGLYRAGALAVTQFEAADARRVFPCFDEPAFKARWQLTLSGVPDGAVALSNGAPIADQNDPRGGRRVTFAETPVLSSYLVAAVVGPLEASPSATTANGVPVRTWAVPGKRNLTGFAQEAATAVLPRLEDYFGLPYPFGKLDQIGVPDFEAGAMENAGAVTFREVALLLDPATAPLALQKRVAEVITHELAHQWFGNLVTMVWWDDLWLNEAFATWMAYKIVDQWRPEWRIWMDFETGKGGALLLDALRSAHPIRADVHNAEEAGESFDAITYEKGGAVLRMIEGFLGEERFREGIRLYMRRHREGNATADDLWAALGEASGQPILEMANGWIRQMGYPLVTLTLAPSSPQNAGAPPSVQLTQRRFLADPGGSDRDAAPRWLVPAVLRFRDARGIKEQPVLLRDGSAEFAIAGAEGPVAWCIGNADARGFFRTAYDPAALARLLPELAALRPAERMTLVSDQWALVRAGEAPLAGFLDLVTALREESDYVVLDEAIGRLFAIEARHVADADRDRFGALVGRLYQARAATLGWGPPPGGTAETAETRLLRASLLRALVLLARAPAAVSEAERRLPPAADAAGGGAGAPAPALDPNLVDMVVVAAARSADGPRFEELRRRARVEADPAAKRRYLHALARVETPELIARAVELALGDDVPMQDFTSYFGVLLANRATREQAWRLMRDRWDEVRGKAASPILVRRLVESLAVLPERRHLDEVRDFLAAHPVEGARQATAQTLERLQIDVALRERLMPELTRWLDAARN
jgi:puromycin-sensitive aminopeptidase